jgi:outer membrane protein assembly factor BamB
MRWCRRIGAAFGGLAVAGLVLPATTGMAFARTATAAGAATASNAVAYQIDPRHDGNQRNGILNVSKLTRKWSVKLGQRGCCYAEGGDVSYPIIAGGRVFVTVENAQSYGGRLYALSATSGATLWSVALPGTYGFSALAFDRGDLYALNYNGVLTAFAARTGHELWASQMPGQWAFTAPPTAYNGVVYVSGAGDGGTVYAVSETNGAVKWTASVMNGDASSPAVDGTGIYVSYDGQQDYGFGLGGRLMWHHQTCCEGGGGSTAVLHGTHVYARGQKYADTPAILAKSTGAQTGSFASLTAPAFGSKYMYTLYAGTLSAVNPSGSPDHWTFGHGTLVTAPVVSGGTVFAGNSSGTVYGVSAASGRRVWTGRAGSVIYGPDEQSADVVTGMAVGGGLLVVPAGRVLTAFGG